MYEKISSQQLNREKTSLFLSKFLFLSLYLTISVFMEESNTNIIVLGFNLIKKTCSIDKTNNILN